jgi:hypothetical protein
MKRRLTYRTNDYGWAIYDLDTKALLAWGQFGDDLFFGLKELGKSLNFTVSSGTLPDFDGEAPAATL